MRKVMLYMNVKMYFVMRNSALLLFLLPSFSALADDNLYSWKAQNCPALPSVPESNPYLGQISESMGKWDQQESELMTNRGIRFTNCRHAITSGMSLGINAFRSYQSAQQRGMQAQWIYCLMML